jgi:hypothetical protein
VLVLLGCAHGAEATKRPTRPLVATASREDEASPLLNSFLNERLQRELKALRLQGQTWPAGYTTDASILKLDYASHAGRDRVSCTVLLTLLDATHSPVAIVRGNASAAEGSDHGSLARDAVAAAAHSAVSQLPHVFRQLSQQ